jgi:hypothetical protein
MLALYVPIAPFSPFDFLLTGLRMKMQSETVYNKIYASVVREAEDTNGIHNG